MNKIVFLNKLSKICIIITSVIYKKFSKIMRNLTNKLYYASKANLSIYKQKYIRRNHKFQNKNKNYTIILS